MRRHEEKRIQEGNRKPLKIREQRYLERVRIKDAKEQPPEEPKGKVAPEAVFSFIGKYKGILLHIQVPEIKVMYGLPGSREGDKIKVICNSSLTVFSSYRLS